VVSVAVSADAIDYLRRYGLAGDKKVYPTIDKAIAALDARKLSELCTPPFREIEQEDVR
jgi:hypothetical protein